MVSPSDILAQEEKFRQMYSELQGITPEGLDKDVYELARSGHYDLRKFKELLDELADTRDLLMVTKYEYSEIENIYSASERLIEWIDEIERYVDVFCARRYPFMICQEFPTDDFLRLQDEIREAGIECGLITKGEEHASFVRVVDSFTNCLHSLGLKLAEIEETYNELKEETNGICVLVEEPEDPVLIDACKTFARYVERNKDCYALMDVGKQKGYIYRDKIQFDVGGQAGHRAEIDLGEGIFRYYDPHSIRPHVFTRAISNVLGLDCDHVGMDEFVCKPVSKEHVEELARALAFIPSFDIYINDTITDYKWEICVPECEDKCYDEGWYTDKCKEICEPDCRDEEDFEECLEECVRECEERSCRDACLDECAPEAEEVVSERAEEGLEDVLRSHIDHYCDLVEYLREGG